MRSTSIYVASLIALIGAACGDSIQDADSLNQGGSGGTGNESGTSGSAGTAPMGGTAGTGGTDPVGGTGATAGVSTTGGSAGAGATAGSPPTGGTGGSGMAGAGAIAGSGGSGAEPPMGGTGGDGMAGGSAGSGVAGMGAEGGSGGSGGSDCSGAYCPRTGSFKMLVYSQVCCGAFAHSSRTAGQRMLQAIGQKQGFEVVLATDDSEINPTGLAQYELVFFLNSTGDLWQSGNLRRDYETWIRNNGAYAGMHGATDSASSWAFYKELTGQYYDLHDDGVVAGTIQWTEAGLTHVAGRRDLPNPWNRQEEWYRFRSWQTWSAKPGFTVLNTVTTTAGGTRPVSYLREWENIRAFYTSLGHADAPYTDDTVIKHVTSGIMWAVRREALIVP